MPASADLLSVIVITRNRAQLLGDCLNALIDQDRSATDNEVIVVDDGSTDRTRHVVESIQRDAQPNSLRYVARPHGGVNAARNTGIEHARGQIVMLIDDDEIVPAGFLRKIAEELADPHIHGIGGPCRDVGRSGLRTCPRCSLATVDLPGEGRRAVPRLLGGNMAVRADLFRTAGLFDEAISGRGDESEWFHRAQGYTFLFEPDLWVWHRRDHFTWPELVRHAFVQGMSVPLAAEKQGKRYRPRYRRFAGALAHAVRHRCARGVMLAARELGAIAKYLRLV
jgi:glycosyltransferase involved in cell wall biosynthesis